MTTIIELVSGDDTITFYPTPDVNGWVYNNTTLDRWYALAPTDPDVNKRPNAHGIFGLGQVFTKEHRPILSGQYYGTSTIDALRARRRLTRMYNDGNAITMRVTDEEGTTRRTVTVADAATEFHYDFTHCPLDLAMIAEDPRRYGPEAHLAIGMPAPGSGLVWNLGTSGSGLYWDWGTEGVTGLVTFTNDGDTTTFPRLTIGGAGAFALGFRVTELETGRELTVNRATNFGDVIELDSLYQRATLSSGGDVSGTLSSRDWFSVPRSATRRYQVTPLGGVTGAPTMDLYASPAYL